jgi:hypothetical protein
MQLPIQAQPVSRNSVRQSINDKAVTPSACADVTIEGGQACLNLPVVGSKCIKVPDWVPNGTVASACTSTCYTNIGFGVKIPTGACLTVKVAGEQVSRDCFGSGC